MSGYSASPVQDIQGVVTASGSSLSYTSTPTAGNLLLAYVFNETSISTPVVSDTLNGNWTLLASATRSASSMGVFVFGMIAGASQPKPVTVTLASTTMVLAVQEWSGNPSSLTSIVDGTPGTAVAGATGSTSSGAAATASAAADLLITAIGWGGTVTAPSVSGSFTNPSAENGPSGAIRMGAAYYNPGSTGTFTPTWSWTTTRGYVQFTLALVSGSVTGTAAGALSIGAGPATGSPKPTGTGSGSLSLQGAATSKAFAGDQDAVAGIATFPFVASMPEPQLSASAPAFLTIAAGSVSGTPAITGTGSGGSLSISTNPVAVAGSAITGTLSITPGTPVGKPNPTQTGEGGTLSMTANTPSGTPNVTAGSIAGSLTISGAASAGAIVQGSLTVSANTVTGAPNPTQTGETGSLTITAGTPVGTPAVTLSGLSGSLGIVAGPVTAGSVTGLVASMSIVAGPVTGTPAIIASMSSALSITGGSITGTPAVNAGALSGALSIATTPLVSGNLAVGSLSIVAGTVTGTSQITTPSIAGSLSIAAVTNTASAPLVPSTLTVQAGTVTGSPGWVELSAHGILVLTSLSGVANASGGTLAIGGVTVAGPRADAALTITAGPVSGVAFSPSPAATFYAVTRTRTFYAVAA